jgi:hypothetical protein
MAVPTTNIKFSNIVATMGGPTTNIMLSKYGQFNSPYYALGVSGVPGTTSINVNAFAGKSRALAPNLIYRVYHNTYTFTAAGGGTRRDGGGGGGGINVYSNGNLVGVSNGPGNGGGDYYGDAGGGFGAGGGGGSRDGSGNQYGGGRGGNGFVYIKIGNNEYFYTSNTSLTFPISGTATIIIMGGGGGGGYGAFTQTVVAPRSVYYPPYGGRCYVYQYGTTVYYPGSYQYWAGGAGGGAGYLNYVTTTVSGGGSASIVVGGGGGSSANGGTSSVTIGGSVWTAGGGYNGHDYLGGAPGSSYGGSGSYSYGGYGGGNGASGGSATGGGTINPIIGCNVQTGDSANFNGLISSYSGTTSDLSSIGGATGSVIANNFSYNFGIELIGYFYAPLAGVYTFSTTSVNSSAIWLGATANSGYNNTNRLVNNTGTHGSTKVSSSYTLAANSITAIYIQYATPNGSYGLSLSFYATSGGSTIIGETTNFTNYIFYSLGTNATYPTR